MAGHATEVRLQRDMLAQALKAVEQYQREARVMNA